MKSKRFYAYTMMLFVSLLCVSAFAQKMPELTFDDLPIKSQSFIVKYLPGKVIEHVHISRSAISPEYNVVMRNGVDIVFDAVGNWKTVEGYGSRIPITMLPKAAQNYLEKERNVVDVVRIVREGTDYKATLADGLVLRFDRTGKYVKAKLIS